MPHSRLNGNSPETRAVPDDDADLLERISKAEYCHTERSLPKGCLHNVTLRVGRSVTIHDRHASTEFTPMTIGARHDMLSYF